MFLPESEYHELALLLVWYLLKKNGVRTIYLGANTPFSELETIIKHHNPDYIYTHTSSSSKNFNFENFISTLAKRFKNNCIVISGRLSESYTKKTPPNVVLKKSLSEVKEFINTI